MITSSFQAMGTSIHVWCRTKANRDQVVDRFEHIESTCSRFRHSSELSRVNASTAPAVEVSDALAQLLQAAMRARTLSGGLVDIAVGSAVMAWGYDRTFTQIEDLDVEPSLDVNVLWSIQGCRLWREPSVRLDLGGVAKGWTCDSVIESGQAEVVSAGGDIRSAHPDTTAAIVGSSGETIVNIHVGEGALATSSTEVRRWNAGNSKANHIIDPRTLRPVDSPVVSASVLADTALDAEVGAKTVLILGSEGLAWASDQTWISGAVAVWTDGSVYGTGNLVTNS